MIFKLKVHPSYFKLPKIYKLRTQPLVSCDVVIVILTLGVPLAAKGELDLLIIFELQSTLKLLQITKLYVLN